MFVKEILLITTKSISYQYDNGIIKTNLKTITYNRLGTGFEKTKDHNGKMKGYLSFYDYDSQTNLRELIHQIIVLLELEKVAQLDSEISKMFVTEFNINNGFIVHSAN